ncbi:hypothetical protein L3Y34_001203 [Caenorhabditis briggsae]|uniref:Uncharacterized protein n=1 Tax=Caenorhabditis briggsae TaxID=6238 RepID=A0AAE9DBJ3_CAEBR|nr:hypothetical protein L3Y34_001203 [Caenorhabditis briggsae]
MLFSGTSSGQSSYNTNSVQRDSTGSSSSNQPGYLPDYQGDRYTDPQRIADTQALNRAFFDSIGGAPSPPPETPAQQGMNGGSTASPTGSTTTTYAPTTSYGYSTQYYNPSSSSRTSSTGYSNPSSTYGSTQQQGTNQNFVAYDTTNQNSPYYYQRVPSTAQYNSVLGVNAGFPQNSNQNQLLRDQSSNQGYGMNQANNQQMYNTGYNNQGSQYQNQNQNQMYNNPQNTMTTTLMYASSTQQQPYQQQQQQNNNQQMYSNQQYNNQQYDNNMGYNNQHMYNPSTPQYSSSIPSPQYSADAISCCSQVSSTCCYQTQQGYNSNQQQQQPGNNLQYSPSVYQYGRKK